MGVSVSYACMESVIPQELRNEIEQVADDIKAGLIEVEFRGEITPVG